MKADLSRVTFDSLAGYARVLQQQGRPVIDADLNEQALILFNRLKEIGRDLIGPYGGPSENCGFEIEGADGSPYDFTISAGRYYVNGILVENPTATTYTTQPAPVTTPPPAMGKNYLVFLDIWEDLIATFDAPELMEPALGGIDTALRTRIAWQVRVEEIAPIMDEAKKVIDDFPELIKRWQPPSRGQLRARIATAADEGAPELAGDADRPRYRGQENQLYRVEIHYGGVPGNQKDGATLKWSRENGAVAFRLREVKNNTLTLDRLDAGGPSALAPGDWLEEIRPGGGHNLTPRGPLTRVLGRGPGRDQVTVEGVPALDPLRPRGLWLRRWDQKPPVANRGRVPMRDGTLLLREGTDEAGWIALENGIEVQFTPGSTYRPGDHWIIPARVADGGRLLWPEQDREPLAVSPHGDTHGYAPLAIVTFDPIAKRTASCRLQFSPLASRFI